MRRMMFVLALVCLGCCLAACAGGANREPGAPAPLGQKAPVDGQTSASGKYAVDGAVKEGEYPAANELAPFTVWAARYQGSLRVAVAAKTRGWVALGIGSRVMNKATMFLGMVKDGKPDFTEQAGLGHGHKEVDPARRLALKNAVREEGGVTTMEFECPAAKAAAADAKEITVILALSQSDSFSAGHSVRRVMTVKLE